MQIRSNSILSVQIPKPIFQPHIKIIQNVSISQITKNDINSRAIQLSGSLLWEGFVTPILADSSAPISRNALGNRNLNGLRDYPLMFGEIRELC